MARDIMCSIAAQMLMAVLLAPAVAAKIPWWNIKIAQEQG
jgi:Na+-translocating ferredoxin:NAD+ oxidoreductase RnfD subunit